MLIPDFSKLRVLVYGDVMIDEYVDCTAQRLSQEAPVPILRPIGAPRIYPGGAANVANNAAALSASVTLIGVHGREADCLFNSLRGKFNYSLAADLNRPQTRKTRYMVGQHQIMRFDVEDDRPIMETTRDEVLHSIKRQSAFDAIIVSDYQKGALSHEVMKALVAKAEKDRVPIFAGAKTSFAFYLAPDWIVCNQSEYDRFGPRPKGRGDMLITRGAAGMTLVTYGAVHFIPAIAQEIFDVAGAGDTVLATFALAVTAGMSPYDAAQLANAAAGIAVSKRGTYAVGIDELREKVRPTL